VATGENFSLALSQKGEVYSWGINSDGQLGHGHKSDIKIPKKIHLDSKVIDIACGDSHSVLLSGWDIWFG
jgi:E3 ubiquitin-protein ligase HERC4